MMTRHAQRDLRQGERNHHNTIERYRLLVGIIIDRTIM